MGKNCLSVQLEIEQKSRTKKSSRPYTETSLQNPVPLTSAARLPIPAPVPFTRPVPITSSPPRIPPSLPPLTLSRNPTLASVGSFDAPVTPYFPVTVAHSTTRVETLPTDLQRYIFQWINTESIQDLFNFARCFSNGPNLVFEFFDIKYLDHRVPARLRNNLFRNFMHNNPLLLRDASPERLPYDLQAREEIIFGTFSPEHPYSLRFLAEDYHIRHSFFKDIHAFMNELMKLGAKFNFPQSFLFRSDSRDYKTIFNTGFIRRSGHEYRPSMTESGDRTAAFSPTSGELMGTMVSTTSNIKFAKDFDASHDWIYVCIPHTGFDLAKLLNTRDSIASQHEIALFHIPNDEIMMVYNKITKEVVWNGLFSYFTTGYILKKPTISEGAAAAAHSARGKTLMTGVEILFKFIELYPDSALWTP